MGYFLLDLVCCWLFLSSDPLRIQPAWVRAPPRPSGLRVGRGVWGLGQARLLVLVQILVFDVEWTKVLLQFELPTWISSNQPSRGSLSPWSSHFCAWQVFSIVRALLVDPDVLCAFRPLSLVPLDIKPRMGLLLRLWQAGGLPRIAELLDVPMNPEAHEIQNLTILSLWVVIFRVLWYYTNVVGFLQQKSSPQFLVFSIKISAFFPPTPRSIALRSARCCWRTLTRTSRARRRICTWTWTNTSGARRTTSLRGLEGWESRWAVWATERSCLSLF